jgi:hypothetical protein
MVIPQQLWSSAESFRDGLAAVGGGTPFRFGYIDKTGKYIIEPRDGLSYGGFHDGLMKIKEGKKWGYIDKTGRVVIPPAFVDANNFSCGLAGVVHESLGAGYINAKGDWVIRLNSAVPDYEGFSEGLAPVWDKKSRLFGYITTNGTFAIAPRFKGARAFHQGRAAVRVAMKDETGWPVYKWGAIDIDGKLVVPAQYKTVWSFEEGMAKVVADTGSGFVNLAGELVVPCAFQNVEPFKNGLASVEVGSCLHMDTVWKGYINKKGEFVWRPSNYKTLDEARAKVTAEEERKPSIVLRKDAGTNEKGLLVTWPKKVLFTGDKAVIPIRVLPANGKCTTSAIGKCTTLRRVEL